MSITNTFFLALASACVATAASAQVDDYGNGMLPFTPSVLLENKDGHFNHWSGIGRLESLGNRMCTAVLIDSHTTSSAAESPAYVLTSGHCAYTRPSQMGADMEIEGHVEFNYFKDTPVQRKVYRLKRINWSSLRGIDLALLELDAPLSRLREDGITPMKLAEGSPQTGGDVLSVSAPLASNGNTLRLSACTLDSIANIIEHPYAWNANLSNRCEDVLPGSSGSPLIDRRDNTVIGIMGTTTRGATQQSRCFADSPCEINNGEALWRPDTNYASPVDALQTCFAEGVFTPSRAACTLQSTAQVTLPNPYYRKKLIRLERDEQGAVIAPRWDMQFTINTSQLKFKTTRNPDECRKADGYRSSRDSRTAHINSVIGTEPGVYSLCIVGHNGNEGDAPGVRENAFIHSVELIEGGETPAPNVTVQRLDNGKHHVAFSQSVPTHSNHAYKFGAPDSTDCAAPNGYKTVYYNFTISQRLLSIKLCTLARDESGQASAPRTDLLIEADKAS
ncbi:trypsin-like peptidase domain-containing protein [Pseudomonas sp. CDFA 602]|uniref:trypsin-like serine peptidase n=1 Tax=Pseudomonas californiensis TaxID=2829823 RepID=UPI001E491252|nr:serine protease [Pseudomonas californiensis]MCD5996731.1 trypsin-like peptidase domain-containing protein [Pseudomonas californiensis]MCD6002329.1 trypsin-like peptidase domain-containing protein [Pseudomonas californiensis]